VKGSGSTVLIEEKKGRKMNYNSLEYVTALVCEKFKLSADKFEVKPVFEDLQVINDTGAVNTYGLINKKNVYYFGVFNSAVVSLYLMACFNEIGLCDLVSSETVIYRTGANEQYNEKDTNLSLFNGIKATSVPDGTDTKVTIIGWKITLLER
jgi:hypothetical protein